MAGILGVGSGINGLGDIVKSIVDAEKAPKTQQLDRLEKTTTARFTALGTVKSSLSGLQTAIQNLNKPSLFTTRTASSSASGVLTAKADADVPAGKYSIQVQQLATSSKIGLQSVANSSTAKFDSGKLTISTGSSSFDVDVTASNNSLSGIRDAINAAGKEQGVSATIVSDSSGSRLVLSSSKSGDGNDIKVTAAPDSVTTGGLALDTLEFDPAVTSTAPDSTTGAAGIINKAQSAIFFVDGLKVVSESNSNNTAIAGVTLNLVSAQSSDDIAAGKTVDVTVGVDKATVKSNIQKFVDAYNGLMNSVAQQTAVVPVEGSNPVVGALVGDATMRGLVAGLRNELVKMVGDDGVRALAQMGITTTWDSATKSGGTLKIDDAKLSAALDKDFEGVADYLTGSNGLMGRLDKNVNEYLKAGGVFDQRTTALNNTLKGPGGIDEQRKTLDARIAKLQERLTAQYTAMDQLVSRLQKTGESLSNQLASLPGFVRKDK